TQECPRPMDKSLVPRRSRRQSATRRARVLAALSGAFLVGGSMAAPLAASASSLGSSAGTALSGEHWWAFEGNARDMLGGLDGTLQSGATFAASQLGKGLSLDGVDDYVDLGTTVGNFSTSDFTVSLWAQTTSTREEGVIGKRPICGGAGSWWDMRKTPTGL